MHMRSAGSALRLLRTQLTFSQPAMQTRLQSEALQACLRGAPARPYSGGQGPRLFCRNVLLAGYTIEALVAAEREILVLNAPPLESDAG
jgi:hypothetical protein